MPVVTPDQWYRIWWTLWTVAALVAVRLWIVRPIVHAQDRTTAAIERQTSLLGGGLSADSSLSVPSEGPK